MWWLYGTGIACGLDVRVHWNPDCRSDRVIVGCGLAIDCCGREIVVPHDVVAGPMPWGGRPTGKDGKADDRYVLILCLAYRETATEKVPVLYNAEACCSSAMEYGRVREGYVLEWKWILRDDLERYGWRSPRGCAPG